MTDDDELDAKLNEISQLLDQAADIYSRQKNEDGEPDGGRFGTRIALHAALKLLGELEANSSQLKPLNRLVQALLELDHGTVADIIIDV